MLQTVVNRSVYGLYNAQEILKLSVGHTVHHPIQTQEEALLSSATQQKVLFHHRCGGVFLMPISDFFSICSSVTAGLV